MKKKPIFSGVPFGKKSTDGERDEAPSKRSRERLKRKPPETKKNSSRKLRLLFLHNVPLQKEIEKGCVGYFASEAKFQPIAFCQSNNNESIAIVSL